MSEYLENGQWTLRQALESIPEALDQTGFFVCALHPDGEHVLMAGGGSLEVQRALVGTVLQKVVEMSVAEIEAGEATKQ